MGHAIALAALAACIAAVLAAMVRCGASTLGGPVAIVAAFLGLQFVARPLVLAAGLDEPYLQNPSTGAGVDALALRAALLAVTWAILLAVPPIVLRNAGRGRVSTPSTPRTPRDYTTAVVVLTGIGGLGTAWYAWKLGGPFELTGGRKRGQVTPNPLVRSSLLWAATLAAADCAARPAGWRRRYLELAAGVVAVAGGLLWAGRDVIIFPLIAIVALRLAMVPASVSLHRLLRLGRPLIAAAAVALAVAFVARVARDEVTSARTQVTQGDGSMVRTAMVATNVTSFDALMVTRSHWPDEAAFLGATDFRRQLPGPLGRAPAAGEPATFNVRVAQVGQPGRVNGTPPTAAGDWWAAGGYGALAVGALASGLGLAAAERRHAGWSRRDAALTAAVTTIAVAGAAATGLTTATAARLVSLLLPGVVVALVVWLQRLSRGRDGAVAAEHAAAPAR